MKVDVFEPSEGKRLIALSVADGTSLRGFSPKAKVRLRLYENKTAEILDFGTLETPKTAVELKNTAFVAPSCQLRIVSTEEGTQGLLLGSTDTWTLKTETPQEGDKARDGILYFLPDDIAPRTWKLQMREQEHPIVYVDKSIPDARTWVRNDPVFISCVFPAIIQQIFEDILSHSAPTEVTWMGDWLQWADTLMPGKKPPVGEERGARQDWIEALIDSFSQRHSLASRLVTSLKAGAIK